MDKTNFVQYFNELSLTCRMGLSYKERHAFDFQCPNHSGPLILVTVVLNPSVLGEMKLNESRAEHLVLHLYTRVIPIALLLTDNFYIHKGWDYVSLRVPMRLRTLDHGTSRMASKYRPSSAMAEVVFCLSKDVYTKIYVYYSEEDGFSLVQSGRPNEMLKYYGLYEQILFPNVKGIKKTENRGLPKELGASWVQRARVKNLDGWEIRVLNNVGTQRTGALFGLYSRVPNTSCKHDRLGIGCECHTKPDPYRGPPHRRTRDERKERTDVISLTQSFLDARI